MTVQTLERREAVVAATQPPPGLRPSRRLVGLLAGVQGAAFVLLVGIDGTLVGVLVRVSVVAAVTGLAVVLLRRVGPLGRGLTSFGLGLVGTVAGAGIGGVYAAKVGFSLVTVAGLIVLTTGVCLLTMGSVMLVRRVRGWWRLLALPTALSLLVFVIYPLTVAVNATNRPRTALGRDTPNDRGLRYEDVTIQTTDGVRLSGWYVPSSNHAAVVVLHGAGSTRSSVLDHGVVLARHGYGVLLLDTRGHGRSGGDAMDLGWQGDLDIDAAVSYLEGRPDVADGRIGVVGLSMGGEQAIAALGADTRIQAVVAEGVTGMQAADHGWVERYGFRGSIQLVIDQVMNGAAGLLSGADRPMALRDAIRSDPRREILLIAGARTTSEAIAGRWFEQASPEFVDLWVVSGAGHIGALSTRPAAWESRVIGFLDGTLLNGAGG